MQSVRLRMDHGADDTPTETAAVRRQKLCEVASLYSQGMGLDAAADLVGIPTPAVESLPVEFNFAPTPERIRAECDAIRATWSLREAQTREVCPMAPQWELPTITSGLGAA